MDTGTKAPEPRSSIDDIIDLYKRDIDTTLIDENLKLTPDDRVGRMVDYMVLVGELRETQPERACRSRCGELIGTLLRAGVELIVSDNLSSAVHGVPEVPIVVDIVCRDTTENMERLHRTLASYAPRFRGTDQVWDGTWLPSQSGTECLKLMTSAGALDICKTLAGRSYSELRSRSAARSIGGTRCLVLDFMALIEIKRAIGRPRDIDAIAELQRPRDEA